MASKFISPPSLNRQVQCLEKGDASLGISHKFG